MRSTCLLLQDLGYEVATCHRAEDVFETARAHAPDAILQDLSMPGLNLREHFARLEMDEATRDIPILLFTASLEAREVARRVKNAGLLEKPFTPQELRETIDRALGAGKRR